MAGPHKKTSAFLVASYFWGVIGQGALESQPVILLHVLSLFNPNGSASQNHMAVIINVAEIGRKGSPVVALVTHWAEVGP